MQRDADFSRCVKVGSGEKSTVRVMVRVRPFVARELRGLDPNEYPISVVNMFDSPAGKQVFVEGRDPFDYDETFWSIPESQKQFQCMKPFADQESIFEVIGMPAVDHAVNGFHSCIFAYGQTGSGKTHTMLGSIDDPGVAPRLVDRLFARLDLLAQDKKHMRQGFRHEVEISFMEIYNEKVKDLFDTAPSTVKMRKMSRRPSTDGTLRGSTAEIPRGSSQRHPSPRRTTHGSGGSPRSSKSMRVATSASQQPRRSGGTDGTPSSGPTQAPASTFGQHGQQGSGSTPSEPALGARPTSMLGVPRSDSTFGEHLGASRVVSPAEAAKLVPACAPAPDSPTRSALRRRAPAALSPVSEGKDDDDASLRTTSPRHSPKSPRPFGWADRQGSGVPGAEDEGGSPSNSPRKVQWTQPDGAEGALGGTTTSSAVPRRKSVRQGSIGAGIRRKSTNTMASMRRISTAFSALSIEDETYRDLKVRQSPQQGTFVEGLTRLGKKEGVRTAEDVKSRMRYGMEHRATAATQMNDTSSRSHAIFQICVKSNNSVAGVQRYAHINLVDLAGSERIKMSGAEGARFHEATRINLSLSTLRRVIDILIENSAKKKKEPLAVIPYRESMLTWILSDSLGGNSKTCMVATVSPAVSNKEDSVITLEYASKAKKIVNTAYVNEQKTSVVMGAMMQEIQALRDRMREAGDDSDMVDELKEEIDRREAEMEQVQADARRVEREQQGHREAIEAKRALLEEHEQELRGAAEVGREHEEQHKQQQRAEQELEEKLLRIEHAEQRRADAEQEHRIEMIKMAERRQVAEKVRSRHQAYKQEAQDLQAAAATRRFQLDFSATRTSNARIRLETEVATLRHRISSVGGEIAEAEDREAALRVKCGRLSSATDGEARRAERVEAECARREVDVAQQLRELHESRERASDAAVARRADDRRLQSAHALARETRLRDARAAQERGAEWRQRAGALGHERDRKRALRERLRRQAAALRDEVAQLAGEVEGMADSRRSMDAAAAQGRRDIAALREANLELAAKERLYRGDVATAREAHSRLAEAHGSVRDRRADIARTHGAAKETVSARFFPTRQMPLGAEAPAECGGDDGGDTPPPRRFTRTSSPCHFRSSSLGRVSSSAQHQRPASRSPMPGPASPARASGTPGAGNHAHTHSHPSPAAPPRQRYSCGPRVPPVDVPVYAR